MKKLKQKGYLLIQVLVFGAVGLVIIGGLIGFAGTSLKYSNYLKSREQALAIAEAGLDYYRWHLAHAPLDFKDGTGQAGPYVHSFPDKNNDIIGQFTLTVIPPGMGSTIVTIQSKGEVFDGSGASRTLESKLAITSLAKYAVVADADLRFGEGTVIFGPIHSNGGIRFDGLANNLVTSALPNYNDPDHTGDNEYAVHTHLGTDDPTPPTSLPLRADVFRAGRQISVPAVSFLGLSADMAVLETLASSTDGVFLSNSGASGYELVLKTTGKFDVYKVNSVRSPSNFFCFNSNFQTGWGTWSINDRTKILPGDRPFPVNGIIFVKDNIWVSGTIDGKRLTIASSMGASGNTSITVNQDLRYTHYNGEDALALIAQNNINVGEYSSDVLRIDGALVAQSGRVGRFYYNFACPSNSLSTLNLYGMIASKERYGFSYDDGRGYANRNITYDGNFLYGPPPSFPLTSDQYQTISWREI
ncbi:MAG: hypothetical protein WCV68_02305 [Candidatus Paceibacterota bacterium]|jgi:hypothetical protein